MGEPEKDRNEILVDAFVVFDSTSLSRISMIDLLILVEHVKESCVERI